MSAVALAAAPRGRGRVQLSSSERRRGVVADVTEERRQHLADALTERDGEPEQVYLRRCAADPLALRIKRADITDKLDVAPAPALNNSDAGELEPLAQLAGRRWPLAAQLSTPVRA